MLDEGREIPKECREMLDEGREMLGEGREMPEEGRDLLNRSRDPASGGAHSFGEGISSRNVPNGARTPVTQRADAIQRGSSWLRTNCRKPIQALYC